MAAARHDGRRSADPRGWGGAVVRRTGIARNRSDHESLYHTLFTLPTGVTLSMESRLALAARVGDIAPFHVMEVQTAARALEAAGRSVVHMEIGEPDFPTPGPVLDAARARARRRRHLLHVGAGAARAAGGDRRALRANTTASPSPPERIDRHRGIVGGAAARAGAPRRPRRRSAAGRSRVPVQPSLHPRFSKARRSASPTGPESRYQLSAASIERAWTARTRAAC